MSATTKLVLSVLLLALTGCATNLSERASHVQIISDDEAKQYEFVAQLTSSSSLTGIARKTGYQNALNDVLDQAAAKGADFIVLDERTGPAYWTTSEIVHAAAYRRKH